MKTETSKAALTANEPNALRLIPVPPHDGMYVCQCGSWDIEGTEWVHLNSGRLVGSEPPSEDYWCPACEEHYDRVVILDADGTNAGDQYQPFKLEGVEPAVAAPVPDLNQDLVNALRECLDAVQHHDVLEAILRVKLCLEAALGQLKAG